MAHTPTEPSQASQSNSSLGGALPRRGRPCEGSVRRPWGSLVSGSVALWGLSRVPLNYHPRGTCHPCNCPWLSLSTPGACRDPLVPGSAAEPAWAGARPSSLVTERGSSGQAASHTGTHRAFASAEHAQCRRVTHIREQHSREGDQVHGCRQALSEQGHGKVGRSKTTCRGRQRRGTRGKGLGSEPLLCGGGRTREKTVQVSPRETVPWPALPGRTYGQREPMGTRGGGGGKSLWLQRGCPTTQTEEGG